MKDWLTIGQFSKRTGVSARALRIYEKRGLITSHTRGENGYRYYQESQVALARQIKDFKRLGFTLSEIESLLKADASLNSDELSSLLKNRLALIAREVRSLGSQKDQIESILFSLKQKNDALSDKERKFIMSLFEEISIVVTGTADLDKTAHQIRELLLNAEQDTPVIEWSKRGDTLPAKPYILVIKEDDLSSESVREIHPDVVVIKDLSSYDERIEQRYMNLYTSAGPHMTTILNAEDRLSLELANNKTMKKGKIFYFSKNKGLEDQIKRIGGILSDGEEIKIFNFNSKPQTLNFKLSKMLSHGEEVAMIASLAAVLDIGLKQETLVSALQGKRT